MRPLRNLVIFAGVVSVGFVGGVLISICLDGAR